MLSRRIQVMTTHKVKGKEFTEVVLYEGRYEGKFVYGSPVDGEVDEAHDRLRMAVTRTMKRSTILTPRADPCPLL